MLKVSVACFFTVALFAGVTASAENHKVEHSSDMPTYHQLMSLSPIDRVNFLAGVRDALFAGKMMSIGNPDGLVTELEQPQAQDKYAVVMDLLVPKASAAGMAWYDRVMNSLPGASGEMTGPHMLGKKVGSWFSLDGGRDVYTCSTAYDASVYGAEKGTEGCAKWDVKHYSASEWNQLVESQKPLTDDQKKAAADEIDRQMAQNREQDKPHNQSETAEVCEAPTKAQRDKFHSKNYEKICIYAGNMSHFQDNSKRETGKCEAPNSWCSAGNVPNCPRGDKISCPKGKVVCNPLVYGMKDSGTKKLYCTDRGATATMDCDRQAGKLPEKDSDKVAYENKHYGFLREKGTAIQNTWDEYSSAYNRSCAGTLLADEFKAVHCRECTVIKNRMQSLHKAFDDKGLMSAKIPEPDLPPASGKATHE